MALSEGELKGYSTQGKTLEQVAADLGGKIRGEKVEYQVKGRGYKSTRYIRLEPTADGRGDTTINTDAPYRVGDEAGIAFGQLPDNPVTNPNGTARVGLDVGNTRPDDSTTDNTNDNKSRQPQDTTTNISQEDYQLKPGETVQEYQARIAAARGENQAGGASAGAAPAQGTSGGGAISQQDYQLKPGETPEQYTARIASARGETPAAGSTDPQAQAQSSIDVITDPVTGNMYSRDLSIPGSTYKPYSGAPAAAPAASIAPPNQTYSQGGGQSQPDSLDEIVGDFGYSFSPQAAKQFKLAPSASFKDVYSDIYKSLGLSEVKKNIDKTLKDIGKLDQELADKIADINDNPWLTEGVRVREAQKLQDHYDLKKAPYAANLTTYQELYNNGREEARYVSTQALQQYNADREFQLDQIQMMQDETEAKLDAQIKLLDLQDSKEDRAYDRDFAERKFAEDIRQFNTTNARISSGGGSASGSSSGNVKLTAAAQEDIATMATLQNLSNQLLTKYDRDGSIAGTGGLFSGSIQDALTNVGIGNDDEIQNRNLVGNILATFAKLRGGTSFTANEQKLLQRYTPTIDDTDVKLAQKLRDLNAFIDEKKRQTISAAGGGGGTIRVRDRASGQTGTIPDIEFDAKIYERI